MKGKLVRPALLALVIAGALMVAGGIAYATIPDTGGVIHGCYEKTWGALRVIDTGKPQKCSKFETPLSWSQTGPQGVQGPQGIQGPQGPTGPTGPSDVWTVDGYGAPDKGVGAAPETLATTPTLPAGSYFVQAGTSLENDTATAMDYVCDLVDSEANTYSEERATGSPWVTLPVQAVVTLASPDTISFACQGTSSPSEAFNTQLSAIAIGTVHS
jgi:hypothetical protein